MLVADPDRRHKRPACGDDGSASPKVAMRALIEKFRHQAEVFVEQEDDFLCLVRATATETGIVLKVLREMDVANGTDLFLLFADEYRDPASYGVAVLARLREEVRLANQLRAKEQKPLFPELPVEAAAGKEPPDVLIAAIAYAKTLVSPQDGNRIVCALFPIAIIDHASWFRLLTALAPRHGLELWMTNVRLFARVESDTPSELRLCPRIREERIDCSPAALDASLKQEASDPTLPEAERMQAALMVYLIDVGHGRVAAARQRGTALFAFYERAEQPGLQAMVLNGEGDLRRRQEKQLARAREAYETALRYAAAAEDPVILSCVLQNLAEIAGEGKQHAEAAEYYGCLADLKHLFTDPDGKAMALSRRGEFLEKAGQPGDALDPWEEAIALGMAFELPHHIRPNLEHFRRVCRQLGRTQRLVAVETELRKWQA
jgi:hypothetical protein